MTRIRARLAWCALSAFALVYTLMLGGAARAQSTTALTGNVSVHVQLTKDSAVDLGLVRLPLDKLYTTSYTTTGAGANAINRSYSKSRTLAASATEDLDLAGVLTDEFGQTLTFARFKTIVVKASAANTNDVQITRPASNGAPLFMAAGDGIALSPGEVFVWVSPRATGKAVTAGTGDLITFTNSAGSTSVTYEVIITGAAS